MSKFDQPRNAVPVVSVAFADLTAAAAGNLGDIVWCPTGIAGAAGLIVSNGTNWVQVADGTTTSAES